MIEEFLLYAGTRNLFSMKDRILLALSGGVDSMVMLHLFMKKGISCGIIHCNFRLRGKESDEDENFLLKVARNHKIPFYSKRFDTRAYASKNKLSIQMAARELRYRYFEEIRISEGYHFIATAHHLNDSAETFIFNITRGTGISGLKGIPPKNVHVVRPLLFATREMISRYAKTNKLKWREDSSNEEVKYSRNLIRHKVIPSLQKLNPNFMKSLSSTMQRIEGFENLVLKWLELYRGQMIRIEKKQAIIDSKMILKFNEPVLLHFLIRKYGFTYDQTLLILRSMGKSSGNQFLSERFVLTCDRNSLVIGQRPGKKVLTWEIKKGQEFLDTGEGDQFRLSVISKPVTLLSPPYVAFLDLSRIQYPLVVRSPEIGDWFQPLGMKGKQKLSDFMINNKIPRNFKNLLRVVCSGGNIAWIAGHRVDERFKVKKNTKKVLKIGYTRVEEDSI